MLTAFLLELSCGSETAIDGARDSDGGGVRDAAATPPVEPMLSPGARLEDCVSEEGFQICGYAAGCFIDGPGCRCVSCLGLDPNKPSDVGICGGLCAFFQPIPAHCGNCRDGQVCLSPLEPFDALGSYCVSESLAHLYWIHGVGNRVAYADFTPYTGEPLPLPSTCPGLSGELTLCGPNCPCGSSDADLRYCSGRSPTHPWGICIIYNGINCTSAADCALNQACLRLTAPDLTPPVNVPAVCVNQPDCAQLAASVPGGAQCN